MSSKKFREFADECMHWAKTARSDREKRIFLQMAETLLNAAVLADRRERREATASKQQSFGRTAPAGLWEDHGGQRQLIPRDA